MEFREDRRRKAFEENLAKIRAHNEAYKEGKYSFKLSPNNLADLSNQQYLRHYVRLVNSVVNEESDHDYLLGDSMFGNKEYPATFDWREKGFITRPKNQKSCGSCYAFSIVSSVEGQLFKRLNKIIELSPQQIVDCSSSSGNHGRYFLGRKFLNFILIYF
jgi:cathepsin L